MKRRSLIMSGATLIIVLAPLGVVSAHADQSDEGTSFVIDGPDKQRPQFERMLELARQDGLSDLQAVDRWVKEHPWKEGESSKALPQLDDLAVAELTDLAEQARITESSIIDIVEQYGAQEEFQSASWELELLYPNSYAGMRYLADGQMIWMGFKDSAPAEAIDLIRSMPGDVPVQVQVADLLPKAAWEDTVNRTQDAVGTIAGPNQVSFDSGTQELEIVVNSATKATDDEIKRAVGNLSRGAAITIERNLSSDDPSLDEDNVMRGGGYLNVSHCTAGYVLRSMSTGAKRLGTAGHCIEAAGPTDTYQLHGSDGGDTTTVTTGWHVFTTSTPDFGYTTTGTFTPYPSFYFDPGDKREVNSVATSRYDAGTWMCHFGRGTYDGSSLVHHPLVGSSGWITDAPLVPAGPSPRLLDL